MDQETTKRLADDPDGLLTYEYIANNINSIDNEIDSLVDNMIRVDLTGRFLVSAARYLNAVDATTFAPQISRLVEASISADREHVFIGDLLESIYGPDYRERADELRATDRNFRRIYQRIYPTGI